MLFHGLWLRVDRFANFISAAEDIEYPGDLVRFGQNVSTEGVVIRVLNSTYHDPPILVSWKHANYSVAWQYPEDLELIEISSAVPFEGRQTLSK